jgi:uncharacterized membrane protein YfcA
MITGFLVAAALALGYTVAVGLLMAATFGITLAGPAFVAREHRIRPAYKLAQELLWLVCAAAGGYVTAAVSGATMPWMSGALLAGIMIIVLWTNTWEMRQRCFDRRGCGGIHSVDTVAPPPSWGRGM